MNLTLNNVLRMCVGTFAVSAIILGLLFSRFIGNDHAPQTANDAALFFVFLFLISFCVTIALLFVKLLRKIRR